MKFKYGTIIGIFLTTVYSLAIGISATSYPSAGYALTEKTSHKCYNPGISLEVFHHAPSSENAVVHYQQSSLPAIKNISAGFWAVLQTTKRL